MRNTRQDKNIQAMIDASVAAAYARGNQLLGVAQNHTQVTLPAASTTAITGTSGGATLIEQATLTPVGTGKFRISVYGGVLSGDTVSHRFTFTISAAKGTAAAATIFTSPAIATAGNATGMTEFSWQYDTTAIGTVGTSETFSLNIFGDNTTSLSVPGGDAQVSVQEIF